MSSVDFVECYLDELCGSDPVYMTERGCCVGTEDRRSFFADGQCHTCIGRVTFFSNICYHL